MVHSNPSNRQDPPEGFTFGFGVGDKVCSNAYDDDEMVQLPRNLRRIDPVHVT